MNFAVKALEECLRRDYREADVDVLLAPFHSLAEDRALWNHGQDGLAVFGAAHADRSRARSRPHGHRRPIGDIDPQVRAAKAYEWALGEPTTWQGDDATQAVVDEDIDHFFRTVDQAVVTYHSQRLACRCCSLRCPNTITAFAPSAATLRSPTSRSTCIPTRCRSMRCANTHGTRCARATCSASRVCPTRIGTSARSGNRRPSRAAEAAIEGRVATLMLEAERMPSSTGLAAM